jgi:hypothetical protein
MLPVPTVDWASRSVDAKRISAINTTNRIATWREELSFIVNLPFGTVLIGIVFTWKTLPERGIGASRHFGGRKTRPSPTAQSTQYGERLNSFYWGKAIFQPAPRQPVDIQHGHVYQSLTKSKQQRTCKNQKITIAEHPENHILALGKRTCRRYPLG